MENGKPHSYNYVDMDTNYTDSFDDLGHVSTVAPDHQWVTAESAAFQLPVSSMCYVYVATLFGKWLKARV